MVGNGKKFLKDRYLYEEAILRHVCSKCIDFGQDGVCHSPLHNVSFRGSGQPLWGSQDPEGCAVFRCLPELVAIAERLNVRKIGPYTDAVRKDVYMKCRGNTPDGKCPLRDTLDCGLDRYLPLVLEAIEEVNAEREELEWKQWRQL